MAAAIGVSGWESCESQVVMVNTGRAAGGRRINDELRSGLMGRGPDSIAAFLFGPGGGPLLRVEE